LVNSARVAGKHCRAVNTVRQQVFADLPVRRKFGCGKIINGDFKQFCGRA
jgi:hypothetical protein